MDEKTWAKIGGVSLMGVPVLYAGFSWIGRTGSGGIDMLLTGLGLSIFAGGAFMYYLGSRSE